MPLPPSGEGAATQVLGSVPDLILSDIMMPGVAGFELCRSIREYHKTREIPCLFVSAKSPIESKLQGMKLGGDDYITKPFDLADLVLKVRRILARRKSVSDSAS